MNSYLIVGGGGMIGRKITGMLEERATAASVTLFDIAAPERSGSSVRSVAASLDDDEAISGLAADRPDVVFQLAAILSGESERGLRQGLEDQSLRQLETP